MGISLGNMEKPNYDVLYKQADIALYSAKDQGRNKVLLFSDKESAEISAIK